MTLDEFQRRCQSSSFYPGAGTMGGVAYCVIGLAGESGEAANEFKKYIRDDRSRQMNVERESMTLDRSTKIVEEAMDAMWYAANLVGELHLTLEEAAGMMFDKIDRRQAR